MTTDSYATDEHAKRLKRHSHLQNRPLSLHQVPDLRQVHFHPDFPGGDCSDLYAWATSFRRMRYDEHPDDYERAFIERWIRGHPVGRFDEDMEFDDWFEEQPAITKSSLRDRQRQGAAGAETIRPIYYPPKELPTAYEGQERLALD